MKFNLDCCSLTLCNKLVNGLDHSVLVEVSCEDTVSKFAIEKNQSQLAVGNLLIGSHVLQERSLIHRRVYW